MFLSRPPRQIVIEERNENGFEGFLSQDSLALLDSTVSDIHSKKKTSLQTEAGLFMLTRFCKCVCSGFGGYNLCMDVESHLHSSESISIVLTFLLAFFNNCSHMCQTHSPIQDFPLTSSC